MTRNPQQVPMDIVMEVERSVATIFGELSKNGWTASELAKLKLAMDGMTGGMELMSASMNAYHDSCMSVIRNLS